MRRLLLLVIFLQVLKVQAQSVQNVAGVVLDDYGHPLPAVTVTLAGTQNLVTTDDEGAFDIQASANAVLLFAHPSFDTYELKVTANKVVVKLVRSLYPQNNSVDVLYDTRKADKILGAVSTVHTGQLTSTPAPLYAYALVGRLPGLYTQQTRGWASTVTAATSSTDGVFGTFPTDNTKGLKGPNDNTEISMRLRGQMPITIIDGVQRDIYTIDPENIESVSVLKDGLSTILLGQRSSRGVLLVTTKKPMQGTPHVSFTAQLGSQTPLSLPTALPSYQYAYLYNEALSNQNLPLAYSYEDFSKYRDQSSPYTHPDVDWFNTILNKNSLINRYSLNISGGGRSARYTVGLCYLNQQGLFKSDNPAYETNNSIKRYTINTNIDVDVTKDFKAQLQIFGRIQDGNQPGAGTDAIISGLYTTPNNAYPVLNPDGSLGGSSIYQRNLYGMVNRSGYLQDYTRDLMANIVLNYKFDRWVKGLWARAQSNLSVYASNLTDRSSVVPSFKFNISPDGDSTYGRYGNIIDQSNTFALTYSAQYFYLQTALGYNRSFGKNNFAAKLFFDYNSSIFNYDLPEANKNIAFNATYDYDGRYYFEGAVNYSGNDRYPPGKQYGLFYAAGIGWDVAKESFIKDNSSLKWINKIKLRGTYGKTGNVNVGYFTWREAFQSDYVFSSYPYGVGRVTQFISQQSILANPNVTWEKADKYNAGIDIALFGNKFSLTAEYYSNRYYDLMQQPGKQSTIIGIAYPVENLGINRFTGVELSATYRNNIKDFNYFLTGNISFEKSKILYMDEQVREYDWNIRTDKPVGATFGYVADGFIQDQKEAESAASVAGYTLQPGDIKYRDLNNDGVINQYDETLLSTTKPFIYYGFTAGFNYKGFDVNVLLQGVQNRTYFSTDYAFGNGSQQGFDYIVNRWTPETQNAATYPRLTPGINANNDPFLLSRLSTFWQHNGNYFRVKNVELGYTLPYKVTKHLKVSTVRLFANGLNLFTHAAYNRLDPEVNAQVYPIQRVINFGLNIKF